MKILSCCMVLCLVCPLAEAQRYDQARLTGSDLPSPAPSTAMSEVAIPRAIKKQGHFTLADWRRLIDSSWGAGMSTTLKLETFDTYWNRVDQTWGGFPNLIINWDSLKNVYRPLVAADVSRGRFYGILSRLTRELNEWHVYLKDDGIDAGLGLYFDNLAEYPNWPSFRYRAGVPILNLNALVFRTPFGAGVTALPDSSALVYAVMPSHPLGLNPGDIILGYDGVPWKQLIRELFNAELPVLKGGQGFSASSTAYEHLCIMTAGMNWGLFDTIDVAKYPTNDTLHYPTSLLKTISAPYFIATEQVPVAGVPFPDLQSNKLVSWGVVQGTSIGYIYAWDWFGVPQGNTKVLFGQAVDDLMHVHNVSGLILDFRTNWGGWPDYANDGFKHLFNADPTSNYGSAYRVNGAGHLDFTLHPPWSSDFFTPTPEIFDHPIAVLTGPGCGSSGDINAFRLRFHPMVRFFGKPTVGAYTDYSVGPDFTSNGYAGRVDNGCLYSHYNNEGYMIHKVFPVDEEVWLTREGVARGEDDVVKRALQWISAVTYAHDVQLNQNSRDTLQITTRVENPLGHIVQVLATLRDGSNRLLDSLFLVDNGAHGDSTAGDGLWGFRYVPRKDDTIRVSIRTDDQTAGTSRSLPNVLSHVYTRRPIISVSPTAMSLGFVNQGISSRDTTLWVSNTGYSPDSIRVSIDSVNLTPSAAIAVRPNKFYLPGRTSQTCSVSVKPGLLAPNVVFRPKIIVASDSGFGQTRFETVLSFKVVITGVANQSELPTAFAVDQNYPNPFNPSTTIKYELPKASDVRLSVYDMLGREVSVLVNERRDAGVHEAKFDASGLSSGIYFYRLQAGDFVQSRKLLLLK